MDVFPNGDGSLPPAFTVLQNVIEKNQRTVIVHGLADFILIAEGYICVHESSSPYILTHGSMLEPGLSFKSKCILNRFITSIDRNNL